MTDWLRNSPSGTARARLLLAHGAGAPMDTDFMTVVAEGLSARGIDVWRFEFPYMSARRSGCTKRPPNPQPELLDCWRERIQEARQTLPPGRPLVIGGKSMGGRMASLIADEQAVDAVVCLGYPFHPPGKPDKLRTEHLGALATPCLIIQGSRDSLGHREEVGTYPLAPTIHLHWLEDGDHDFKPRVKSGYRQSQHWESAVSAITEFVNLLSKTPERS